MQNKQIAVALKVAPCMAALWRGRFIELGIEGLLQHLRPRPAAALRSTLCVVESTSTTQSRPSDATQWYLRARWRGRSFPVRRFRRCAMRLEAASCGVLQGQHTMVSIVREALRHIVGLYLNPPEHACLAWTTSSVARSSARPDTARPCRRRSRGATMTLDCKRTRATAGSPLSIRRLGDVYRLCQQGIASE